MNEIFSRISVRKYKPQPIEREKLELLLRAAMASPTACNQQGWEFLVVTDRAQLQRLSKASDFTYMTADAGAAIVVLANCNTAFRHEYIQQDLGACCENILLEAVSLGLGACWQGIAPVKERMEHISEQFALPDHIQPFSIIAIGYPDESHAQVDRYDENKIHWEKF
jgi:nitroreductase